MKYLKISNEGLLDIRLIALMGGTTKSGSYEKIGHFGTGLKYTMAFLFRNKVEFKIFVGTEEVKVHIEEEQIGETLFEIICIDGHRTSITTQMGEDCALSEAYLQARNALQSCPTYPKTRAR